MNAKRIQLMVFVGELVAGVIGIALFLLFILMTNVRLTDVIDALELTPVVSETASFWSAK